jgi:hypothetical protein
MADKEFKYGVKELAKEMGIQEASARVALRNKSITKSGKSYGWNNHDDLKKVAAKLRSAPEVQKAKKESKKTAPEPKKAAPKRKVRTAPEQEAA